LTHGLDRDGAILLRDSGDTNILFNGRAAILTAHGRDALGLFDDADYALGRHHLREARRRGLLPRRARARASAIRLWRNSARLSGRRGLL
jgi:hypothetical protein